MLAPPEFFSQYDGVTNSVTELKYSTDDDDDDDSGGSLWLGLYQGEVYFRDSRALRSVCLTREYHTRKEAKYLSTCVLVRPPKSGAVWYAFVGCRFGSFSVWRNGLALRHTGKPRACLAAVALVPSQSATGEEEVMVFRLAFGVGLNLMRVYEMRVVTSSSSSTGQEEDNWLERRQMESDEEEEDDDEEEEDNESPARVEWKQIALIRSNKSFYSAAFDETGSHLVAICAAASTSGSNAVSLTLDNQIARMYQLPSSSSSSSSSDADVPPAPLAPQRELVFAPLDTLSVRRQLVQTELGGWLGNQLLASELLNRDRAMHNSGHWNTSMGSKRLLFPESLIGRPASPPPLASSSASASSSSSYKRSRVASVTATTEVDATKARAEEIFARARAHYEAELDNFEARFADDQTNREEALAEQLRRDHAGLRQAWEEAVGGGGGGGANSAAARLEREAQARLDAVLAENKRFVVSQMDDQAKLACIDHLQRYCDAVQARLVRE